MSVPMVHIITGLGRGGSEHMLYKLLSRNRPEAFSPRVISLTDDGVWGEAIRHLGIPVATLGLRPDRPDPRALVRLIRLLHTPPRPCLVQTWLYHADLLGGLGARLTGIPTVLWNLRTSGLDPAETAGTTRWVQTACARLSRIVPRRILCASAETARYHHGLGYSATIMEIIPNGFDTTRFRPDPVTRAALRRQLGVSTDTPLLGHLGRWDPQKDHRTLIRAFGRVHRALPGARFLLAGTAVDTANPDLVRLIVEAGLGRVCHLLGERDDPEHIYPALDLLLSSSYGEGFPNVLGEAMACGLPCVVTRAGDSAEIVGDTGIAVPVRDPRALADAALELLAKPVDVRNALGAAARRRVEREYALDAVVSRYMGVWRRCLEGEA